MKRPIFGFVLAAVVLLPACQALQPSSQAGEPSPIVVALQDVSAQLQATQAQLAAQAAADPNSPAAATSTQLATALGTGQQVIDAATAAAQAVIDEAAKPEPDYGPVITGAGATIAPMTGPAAPWVLLATTLLGGLITVVQTVKKNKAQATTADIVRAIELARITAPALGEVMAQDSTKAAIAAAQLLPTTKAAVKAIKGT